MYICDVMKKVFVIVIAAMCVMSCGQRRAAKSQESSQQEAAPAEAAEVVEHQCCGHHGAEGCPAEVSGKECGHADAGCDNRQELQKACETIDKTVKEATATMKKEAEAAKSEAATIEQVGKKKDPKPIKPVPNPNK